MPVVPFIPAIISAGVSIYSAHNASQAAGNAADAQVQASHEANQLQKYMYDTTRSDNAPWRAAGEAALGRLNNLSTNPNSFTADPGYQWRAQQGIDQIDRSAASRGNLFSGGTLKALDRYNQGFASNEFSNVWNRQAGLAGVGQTANAANAQAGQNYANSAGQNLMAAGQARASGYMNQAAAQNQMAGSLANFGSNIFSSIFNGGGGGSYNPGWSPSSASYNYQGQY
jgi:hypothetical protein